MREGDSWDGITPELLEDCAQLTKANSIDGMFASHSISRVLLVLLHGGSLYVRLGWAEGLYSMEKIRKQV
jgi:hypothetical protein